MKGEVNGVRGEGMGVRGEGRGVREALPADINEPPQQNKQEAGIKESGDFHIETSFSDSVEDQL